MRVYNGMYLGMVIQNNDPEYRGRVKVYVPHIQANVYQDWFKEAVDRNFRFPGKNIQSDLERILPELKTVLPWAENAMPMIGAAGSGRYNAHDQVATISDSNRNETLNPNEFEQTDIEKKYKLNDEHLGESPGKVYESHNLWVHDAFTNVEHNDKQSEGFTWDGMNDPAQLPHADLPVGERLNGVNRPNKYAYNYRPNTYSNCAKGSFSIPNVGSHVWVFFQGGDPLQPVVFGVSHGREDWRGIYDCNEEHGSDYPGTYENVSRDEERVYDVNTDTYRNKYVINQKGGSLEFINTDNREVLKMTHYSGSFLEFNNHVNIELASHNTQRLVMEDAYDTVRGFNNSYTERDYDLIIRGDNYKKVGYQNYNHHLDWRETMRPLAELKGLFEIRRYEGAPAGVLTQARQGTAIPCPVCNDTDRISYNRVHNQFLYTGITDTHSRNDGAYEATKGNMSQGYYDPRKRFKKQDKANGKEVQFVLNMNKYQSAYDHLGTSGTIFGETCPVCKGKGVSPSSMEGDWKAEDKKNDKNFEKMLEMVAAKLAPIESKLGLGGTEVINIAKHKVENIGLVMNDYPSVRIDPVGKMYRDSMVVHKQGVFVSQQATPLIEPVHVDDLPGGSYTMNVSNRWNVHVGSGGVSIKTSGRTEIAARQINMGADQVNIGSENEINIDGGRRLSMVADIITLRQRSRKQVLVDSNLGVSQNVVVGGGMHVEGELSCHHITAPVEIQETEKARIYSKLLNGLTFKCNIYNGGHSDGAAGDGHPAWGGATIRLITDSNDDHVVDYGHSHLFKNAAMHLMETNDLVRETGKDCNDVNGPVRADANKPEVVTRDKKVKTSKFTEGPPTQVDVPVSGTESQIKAQTGSPGDAAFATDTGSIWIVGADGEWYKQ